MRKGNLKLIIGATIALFVFVKYCASAESNPYTGKKQNISITEEQEIAIGLLSSPKMKQQFGGLYPNQELQLIVDQVGNNLVKNTIAKETGYQYEFHLLADEKTINAFSLPGGQIFITYALYSKLENDDQLAGVLGHEIGHVICRHSADRMSKQDLPQSILNGMKVGFDPNTAQGATTIAKVINLEYSHADELESDDLSIKFMIKTGYNPEGMISVMELLKTTSGSNKISEFQSTHPNPENRIEKIKESIKKYKSI